MLIRSPRHTPEDLELWGEYEAADLAHARLPRMRRLVDQAERAVADFAEAGPFYAAVSWGKDSVVVADLVRRVCPTIQLVWVRVEPIKNPDCSLVRDAFSPAHYTEREVWCRRDEDGWHATGTLEAGFAGLPQRRVSGIRSDESGSRKISAAVHGTTTDRSCRPLLRWSAQDVFAYLAARQLPVHPAYACLGGGRWPREHLRVASIGGQRGRGMGRADWEREYYGLNHQTGHTQ